MLWPQNPGRVAKTENGLLKKVWNGAGSLPAAWPRFKMTFPSVCAAVIDVIYCDFRYGNTWNTLEPNKIYQIDTKQIKINQNNWYKIIIHSRFIALLQCVAILEQNSRTWHKPFDCELKQLSECTDLPTGKHAISIHFNAFHISCHWNWLHLLHAFMPSCHRSWTMSLMWMWIWGQVQHLQLLITVEVRHPEAWRTQVQDGPGSKPLGFKGTANKIGVAALSLPYHHIPPTNGPPIWAKQTSSEMAWSCLVYLQPLKENATNCDRPKKGTSSGQRPHDIWGISTWSSGERRSWTSMN